MTEHQTRRAKPEARFTGHQLPTAGPEARPSGHQPPSAGQRPSILFHSRAHAPERGAATPDCISIEGTPPPSAGHRDPIFCGIEPQPSAVGSPVLITGFGRRGRRRTHLYTGAVTLAREGTRGLPSRTPATAVAPYEFFFERRNFLHVQKSVELTFLCVESGEVF